METFCLQFFSQHIFVKLHSINTSLNSMFKTNSLVLDSAMHNPFQGHDDSSQQNYRTVHNVYQTVEDRRTNVSHESN